MLGASQKFTVSIPILALLLILGCNSATGPSVPKYRIGDINNNGIAFEIADVVLFTNYFIYGPGVFVIDPKLQIAATDVNLDGFTLGVADLTYMLRKVHGDDHASRNPDPVEAVYRVYNYDAVTVDIELGAAALQLQGNVEPTLLASNMDMEYAFDAANNVTRVLVYNLNDIGQTFTGEFLSTNASELVRIEMATYEGGRVNATEVELPSKHFLMQNEPNPFSRETVIYFGIPIWADVRFEITNFSGELVFESSDYYMAGLNSLTWKAVDKYGRMLPVGTYYFTMLFEEYKLTIKMQKVL